MRRVRRLPWKRLGIVPLAVLLLAAGVWGTQTVPAAAPADNVARVVRVVDGDTFVAQVGGRQVTVRVIGLDTPETNRPGTPVECYGPEATVRAGQLLAGQTVSVEPDPSQPDRDAFGRLLRHVRLPDGRLFAEVMIREGFGVELTVGRGHAYQRAYRALQAEARAASAGLWAACGRR